MFKNYLLVAVRTLRRNLGYTTLNVVGLALGITCSLLLFLVIRYETSFDTFHSKAKRIYRFAMEMQGPDGVSNSPGSPFPLLPVLQASLPELKPATQVFQEEGGTFTVPSSNGKQAPKRFREDRTVLFVEPAFFDLFDFPTNGVNVHQALKDPYTVLLTESIAAKYFPGEEAVGKVLRMNNTINLKVTGVIPDAPSNTDFPFIMLASYESFKKLSAFQPEGWNSVNSNQQLYLTLAPGASVSQAEKRLTQLLGQYRDKTMGNQERAVLQPLLEMHYDARYGNFNNRTISKTTLVSLGLIGLFLVLVACINFVNLATAQALRRAKEVGMRKVLGASRQQLMVQFLSETGLITLVALLLSVMFTEMLLPSLNQLLELKMAFRIFESPDVLLYLAVVLVVVTLCSGFYPALILSGFQPISALKSRVATAQTAGLSLRRTLVVLQFTICQVLIICTIVVHNQMEYFNNAALGFDKEAIVIMPVPTGRAKDLMALRPQLEAHSAIKSTSFAVAPPSANITVAMGFRYDDSSKDSGIGANFKLADDHYLKTYNIPLVAGRVYAPSDTMREFLVNETFLRKLGIKTPQEVLGKSLVVNGGTVKGPIVGGIKDFHVGSLRDKIEPVIVSSFSQFYFQVAAKIEQKNAPAAIAHLQKVWSTAYPDDVFSYEFLDDTLARFYKEEQRQASLFKIFSVIAILIGCLGLYGLVAFMVTQRTKEVGVRKVLGASSASIVGLFARDFVKLVLLAFVIAVPISYYFMQQWLKGFTYRIDLSYWVFLAAGGATLLIALATVSVKALRAALSDPVLSLKTE
jgi:putative ABC transport system permease protein